MKDLSPDLLVPISQAARGQVPVAFGASPDEALWLTAPKPATGRAGAPRGAAVHRLRFGAEVVTRRYSGPQLPHFIQRTRGGLLFANARQPDDEPNAWVTNDAGRVVRRLALGDGLSDVRVSPRGKIWTAYFDEGVFGGSAGAAGLVARDGAGRKVWAYDARKAGTDDIADVYAFNLAAEDDAWVYFYQPFAQPFVIVRWRKNRPTTWRTRVEGARAIAVAGSEALLFGDYDDPTALRILDLPKGGGSARVKRRLRLRLPRGTNIKFVHAMGSAHRLIVWSDQHLMVMESW